MLPHSKKLYFSKFWPQKFCKIFHKKRPSVSVVFLWSYLSKEPWEEYSATTEAQSPSSKLRKVGILGRWKQQAEQITAPGQIDVRLAMTNRQNSWCTTVNLAWSRYRPPHLSACLFPMGGRRARIGQASPTAKTRTRATRNYSDGKCTDLASDRTPNS